DRIQAEGFITKREHIKEKRRGRSAFRDRNRRREERGAETDIYTDREMDRHREGETEREGRMGFVQGLLKRNIVSIHRWPS
ncbi:hypothetical protein ACQP3L_28900, partial [Escherichia coli]